MIKQIIYAMPLKTFFKDTSLSSFDFFVLSGSCFRSLLIIDSIIVPLVLEMLIKMVFGKTKATKGYLSDVVMGTHMLDY